MLVFLLVISPLSVLAQEAPSSEGGVITEQSSTPTEIILEESALKEPGQTMEPIIPEGQIDPEVESINENTENQVKDEEQIY